jgi:hypothetical protein
MSSIQINSNTEQHSRPDLVQLAGRLCLALAFFANGSPSLRMGDGGPGPEPQLADARTTARGYRGAADRPRRKTAFAQQNANPYKSLIRQPAIDI